MPQAVVDDYAAGAMVESMGVKALEHMTAVTDKLMAVEAEKSALLIANANLTRDLADVKRALARAGVCGCSLRRCCCWCWLLAVVRVRVSPITSRRALP